MMCRSTSSSTRRVVLSLQRCKSRRLSGSTRARSRSLYPTTPSGGTLIALAADEIVMCEHSVLGPIDPQLGDSPAASLISVIEKKPVAKIEDRTLVMADVGRKAIAQVKPA